MAPSRRSPRSGRSFHGPHPRWQAPRALVVTFLAGALAFTAAGCTGKDPYAPGETLGTWSVTGALVSTTCGATPNPWQFDVKLRHEDTTVYWVQGGAPISGRIDPAARATLKASDVRTVREANAKTKTAACTMAREDVVDLTLSPVTTPSTTTTATTVDLSTATSFKGTLSYRFSVSEGSMCDDQLTESGGDFDALPCEVKYTLEARRTAAK